jgi:Chitobiase/beta-hexosaminidase C-terminal domain/Concanavalin A-like lectin/glucanases superfamily
MLISLCLLTMTACSSMSGSGAVSGFGGRVHGGQQPISGASIQFYAAGSSSIGTGAAPILSQPLQTDATGSFSVPPGQFECPSNSSLVYVVSTGGNPGLAPGTNNAAGALMTAIGPCAGISSTTFINISELTTVASIWSLAPFMSSGASVGADPAHQAALTTAFSQVSEFIDIASGAVPGSSLPSGWSFPITKFNTLGDILATCINTAGGAAGDQTACGNLFTNTQPATGAAPSNVLDASLQIARNPTQNVSSLFLLIPAAAPWLPVLGAAPTDWTLPLTTAINAPTISPAGGVFSGTQTITLSVSPSTAVIHYTTDGSTPSASSAVYSGPLTVSSSVTVQAVAYSGTLSSSVSSATFTSVAPVPAQLAFVGEPTTVTQGTTLAPAVSVAVEDASGNVIPSATNPITVTLIGGTAGATFSGTTAAPAVLGQAAFSNLSVATPGQNYQLVATSPGLSSATSTAFSITPAMTGTSFTVPADNTCNSGYDRFYEAEPGVYAYWGLCETAATGIPAFYDYVNRYDWNVATGAWTSGGTTITGGATGPVADGETAAQVKTQSSYIANQNLVLNTNGGSLATWVNTDSDTNLQGIVRLSAISGNSKVWLNVLTSGAAECFVGQWTNSDGTDVYTPQACGYKSNIWHRLAMTWSAGNLTLYVDGVQKGTASYTGTLDNSSFYYSLFPQSYDNSKQMTLAKVTLSNQAWSSAQAAADYAPVFPATPSGGVLVTSTQLGTIHRDVLGVVDLRSMMTSPSLINGLKSGYASAGITSVRYANGASGIWADLTNWNGGTTGVACGANLSTQATPGQTQPSVNATSLDTTDTFVPQVAQPLGLSLGYTVNYGTNPPLCNAGGDPITNGANLVQYLNVTKQYGFKYFEIGNELYDSNAGGLEPDFHVNPAPAAASGATYGKYEPAFYSSMKAVDPTIKIGIPIGINNVYSWIQTWSLPALASANYDAAVYHDYPLTDPVTDGGTLYPERIASGIDRSLGDLRSLQTMLLNAGKSPESIWITEWGNMTHGGSMWSLQSMGAATPMFVTMRLAEYMNAGVQYATYFVQGGDSYCNPYNIDYQSGTAYAWWKSCSSAALMYPGLYPGSVGEVSVGLKAGDLYPAGRSFQLFSQSGFVSEGEHMLKTYADQTNAPWLAAYGATHGASYAVILINRDRDTTHVVPVTLAGATSGGTVQQWTYGRAQYDQSYFGDWSTAPLKTTQGGWTGTFQATLPPWSVNVLIFSK